ncbi:hypothetical protein L7F22_036734 [Adiantum nelumboides]|nr:hypothetical protein [Adiantum nelumboides]
MARSICEKACWDSKRWKVVALMAFQEATEDFLLEYFSDMTIVAAHAHRVTIMDKDIETLKRVRWRYDKLLEPNVIRDKKMNEILLYPPELLREVTITNVTHEVNTRARAKHDACKTKQDARQEVIVKETKGKQKKRAGEQSNRQRESNLTFLIEANLLTYKETPVLVKEEVVQKKKVETFAISNASLLYFDGSYRRSHDAASGGIIVYDAQGNLVKKQGLKFDAKSNNEAEYMALEELGKARAGGDLGGQRIVGDGGVLGVDASGKDVNGEEGGTGGTIGEEGDGSTWMCSSSSSSSCLGLFGLP